MARKKASGYTKEELHEASSQVMKSLNILNRQVSRPRSLLQKDLIANSLGKSAGISKSSKRRRSKKERANLGGTAMDELISTLPAPEIKAPKTLKPIDPHKSRKAQHKLEQQEMRNFKPKTLAEIKAQLLK